MANKVETPADIKIAALEQNKKKGPVHVDLMKPGPGTPWEERGANGPIGGFLKTIVMCFTEPAWLVDSMRRPETTGEATIFAMLCGFFWTIASLIHSYFEYHHLEHSNLGVEFGMFWFLHVLRALLIPGIVYVVVSGCAKLYYAIVSGDMVNKAPEPLVHNIFCYAMGVSIIAPATLFIPKASMWVAAAWITFLVMYMGKKRLFISWPASIIAGVLSAAACAAILAAVFFIGGWVLSQIGLTSIPPSLESYSY